MDFLPATRTKAKADRFGDPHDHSGDDEMVMNANQIALVESHEDRNRQIDPEHAHTHAHPTTQEEGLGNRGTYLAYPPGQQVPALPNDRYRSEATSYDSQRPMAQTTPYQAPSGSPASRNF